MKSTELLIIASSTFFTLACMGQVSQVPEPVPSQVLPAVAVTDADFQDETPVLTERQLADLARFQSETVSRILGVNMRIDGVIPRAFRASNPLQLINPFAPAEYGDGFDNVTTHPLTGRPDGIRFLGVKF